MVTRQELNVRMMAGMEKMAWRHVTETSRMESSSQPVLPSIKATHAVIQSQRTAPLSRANQGPPYVLVSAHACHHSLTASFLPAGIVPVPINDLAGSLLGNIYQPCLVG